FRRYRGHRGLLRLHPKRPRCGCAPQKCHELAPSHAAPEAKDKSYYRFGPGNWKRSSMSALGHKWIFRSAIAMSALPPKADILRAIVYVPYGPIADIIAAAARSEKSSCRLAPLFLMAGSWATLAWAQPP